MKTSPYVLHLLGGEKRAAERWARCLHLPYDINYKGEKHFNGWSEGVKVLQLCIT